MPCRTKATLFAVWIIWNNIDSRNLCLSIHWHMVIGNTCSKLRGEHTSIANNLSCAPNLIYNATGMLYRKRLFIELSALPTYHIKQDSKTGLISFLMQVGRPILCTKCPRIAIITARSGLLSPLCLPSGLITEASSGNCCRMKSRRKILPASS